jgi:predicted house-cleaning noncanonical NTP pyrophosphatase (MazG superfamily)
MIFTILSFISSVLSVLNFHKDRLQKLIWGDHLNVPTDIINVTGRVDWTLCVSMESGIKKEILATFKFEKYEYVTLTGLFTILSFISTVLSALNFHKDRLQKIIWGDHLNVATDIITLCGAVAGISA